MPINSHVGEHDTRALVAVVEQHVDAGGRELAVEPLRGFAHRARCLPAPIGTTASSNGAIARGKMMPRSSRFCSIAAATMRVTPMP